MDKNELITHILTLRREKKILEKRVKTFDLDKLTTASNFNSFKKNSTAGQHSPMTQDRTHMANSQPTSNNNSFY